MQQGFFTLLLGFIIGIQHAFEPDHVVAVSTIVARQKNAFKSALIGAFWGLGHTTTLFVIGFFVLLLKISIPAQLSFFLELLVACMLLLLGFKLLFQTKAEIHAHVHTHNGKTHSHTHTHSDLESHTHRHSLLIGLVHGVAGSGTLMILILSTISNVQLALLYILLFGIGSTLGMMAMSFLMSLPLQFSSKRFPSMEYYIRILAATLSIGFGLFLIYEIGLIKGLFYE